MQCNSTSAAWSAKIMAAKCLREGWFNRSTIDDESIGRRSMMDLGARLVGYLLLFNVPVYLFLRGFVRGVGEPTQPHKGTPVRSLSPTTVAPPPQLGRHRFLLTRRMTELEIRGTFTRKCHPPCLQWPSVAKSRCGHDRHRP